MNELTNHVPILETCQKLKEVGFPQDTYFVWWSGDGSYSHMVSPRRGIINPEFSAPILTELLEQLPEEVGLLKKPTHYAVLSGVQWSNKNPAEAAALLWLDLHKEDL
jgi:hypothetical protein